MAPVQAPATADANILHTTRIAQYVPLPPTSLHAALPAIAAEVFSPLLLTYHAPVKGVVLAYENVSLSAQPPKTTAKSTATKSRRASSNGVGRDGDGDGDDEERAAEQAEGVVLTRCMDEYMAPFVWASATLLVWRPAPGAYIDATVTHASATHVTLAHLNTFAVTVLKEDLPGDWSWTAEKGGRKTKGFDGKIADEGGFWMDGELGEVKRGREFRVRVREWDVRGKGRGVLRVEGSLVSSEEEQRKKAKKAGKKAIERSAGAQAEAEAMQVD